MTPSQQKLYRYVKWGYLDQRQDCLKRLVDSEVQDNQLPPIPEYKTVKIPFTRAVSEAFGKNVLTEIINLTKI